jgi:hypothetical protein
MKRSDIDPGGVYSLVSYRNSRQGWPVMILSQDSYERHHRTKVVTHAGRERLVQGDYQRSAVGLLTVKLAFDMHSGQGDEGTEPPMDVLDFRAKVERVHELASVEAGVAALNESIDKAWDDREHLYIRDAEGELLGTYELLTSLQMVRGSYVPLTLDERRAEAQRAAYATEHEQARLAAVAEHNELADRLDALGFTGYHEPSYASPGSAMSIKVADLELLVEMAERYASENAN